MTTWLEGDQFPYPHDRRFCLEIGEHQVWGYVRDSNAYYTVRYWEGGITKWTPETPVMSGVDNETCQVRLSPMDGRIQYSVGKRNFYIRPQDI